MALTNIELYEELKKTVTEDAARMIAEVVPKAYDLATKGDIERLAAATKGDIERLAAATKGDIERLAGDFERLAGDVERLAAATKGDIERLAAATKSDFALLESNLKSYIDSRFLRYTATVVIPMCALMVGALITLIVK